MNKLEIYEIPEAPGLFTESVIIDSFNQLVFASFWGHTAAIQTVIARVTAGDLSVITVNETQVSVSKEMIKKVGKLPKNNAYGDMTHALIYRTTAASEHAGIREILHFGEPPTDLIYRAIQSISAIPLIDDWQKRIIAQLRATENLIDLQTVCGNVHGVRINLGNEDEFGEMVSGLLKSNLISI